MVRDQARRALALALLASAAIPGLALAQTETTRTASQAAVSELVVTAQKRVEALQNVPLSVSAVPGRTLEQLHATDLQDWSSYVPGLTVGDNGAPGEANLAIDGIGPIAAASEVGIYVDDTPVGSSSSFEGARLLTLDLMPYDLDRIEVLRGPQGTLYGASTMGGLIKYVLDAPDPSHFSARVGGDLFGISHSGGVGGGGRGEANLPVNDQLALRVSGFYESTPGYIDNATTGRKDDNPVTQWGGRAALLWRPTSDVSVQLSALYQRNHSDNQNIVALDTVTQQPIAGQLTNINTRDEPFTQSLQLYDLTLNWNLHWAQLTSVTSYQRFDNTTDQDLTEFIAVPLGLPQADLIEKLGLSKFTQEVRLTSPAGQKLEWLAGAFYTHEDATNHEQINAYDANGAPLTALNPLELVTLPSTYQEYAFFGDVTYHFTDWFDLSGGLRYAHNDQTFVEQEGGSLLNPADPSAPVVTVPGRSSEGVWTFQVSPAVHFNKNTMAYARVATGYQPGGPNVVLPGVVGLPTEFFSSRLTDYQVGVKSTLLDGRASLDLSAFYIDWSKIQVSVLVGAQSAVENAGSARSQGFDFSGSVSPIDGLTLGATLAYTDAFLTSDVPSIGVVKGAQLAFAPRWSGSLTADYSAALAGPWRGFIGGGYRYVGSRFSAPEGSTFNGLPQGIKVGAANIVDLHLGARTSDLTLSLFAKNLFDERAYVAPALYFFSVVGTPIDIQAPVLQPRTIGVSIDKSF
ncbi:MAG TPA: TonB-dependent receptor [Caulobacteraceae bacterium]|nr:TonB-dependent receptor [Caulobacteraceae bacterium]